MKRYTDVALRQNKSQAPSTAVPLQPEINSSGFTPQSCKPRKNNWLISLCIGVLCLITGAVAVWFIDPATTVGALGVAPMVMVQSDTSLEPAPFLYGPQQLLSQPSFFEETLTSFKEHKQSFVEADLFEMKIRYYDKGSVVFEAPILTKGKEGSWWETPAGLYDVGSKSESHFSSFGHVYTPWNIVFQGNFFIHGWPYYPDGTPVASQYSGGCIRLADVDAEALYRLANVNTPILVYEKADYVDDFSYSIALPKIDAKAFLVADVESGTILAQSGTTEQLPIASVTKLMTAIVAAEYINLDKDITISESAVASTSVPRLKAGMTMSAYSLLLPLLLESSNTAANTYAQMLGSSRFVELMNKKAQSLGMKDTKYTDASGADAGNVSTLYDLLRLSGYIYNNRSFIYKISSGENVSTAYDVYPFGVLSNFNKIEGLEGFLGGKVGKTTAAQETIISLYKMNINGTERTIVFIALGTPDNYKAVEDLYAYIQKQYGTSPL